MPSISRTTSRVVIAIVALANAALFIGYQSRDWLTEWTDQNGYIMLGRALAQTGRFTRYPLYPRFIPEVIRTPGYPAFVAVVFRTIGEGHLPVAAAQAVLFAATCILVFETGRRFSDQRTALAAGIVVALYPTLPYFAALVLTETLTTFLVVLSVYWWLGAMRTGRWFVAAAGFALAAASITRPAFQYLPVALLILTVAAAVDRREAMKALKRGAVVLLVYAAALAPWVIHNYVYFGTASLGPPAAGIGRTMWEGNWQIAFPGRVQARLTELAETLWDRAALDREVGRLAASSQMDAEPMLRYVHEWQTMRRMWDDPQDPPARAAARAAADGEYGRLARENIGRDPLGHAWRRIWRGVPLLWITEIPVRYSDINRLPGAAIRVMWMAQVLITLAGAAGLVIAWRLGARFEAAAVAAVCLYITAVHVVLYSEARYTLPARPLVLLSATIAVRESFRRRRGEPGAA
jgi:4-amino-4-deoxy-L-arabinose transferase-like glycosyltransferase